jgi:hypothetical protein
MDKFRILAIDFDLETVDRLRDTENVKSLNGHITFDKPKIRLDTCLEKQNLYEVLWHEVIHGIFTLYMPDVEIDENNTDRMAQAMCQIMRDNKKILDKYYPWKNDKSNSKPAE